MLSVADIRDANTDGLLDAAKKGWAEVAQDTEMLQENFYHGVIGNIEWGGWKGEAAESALFSMNTTRNSMLGAMSHLGSVATILEAAHDKFRTFQELLNAALAEAADYGFTVADDGTVNWHLGDDASEAEVQQTKEHATRIADKIHQIREQASEEDGRVARSLWDHVYTAGSENRQGRQQLARKAIELQGGVENSDLIWNEKHTPGRMEVENWWYGLTASEQHQVISAYPERIAELEGVPTEARQQATRVAYGDTRQGPNSPQALIRDYIDSVPPQDGDS